MPLGSSQLRVINNIKLKLSKVRLSNRNRSKAEKPVIVFLETNSQTLLMPKLSKFLQTADLVPHKNNSNETGKYCL